MTKAKEELIILESDDKSATYRTGIKGWVSRGGHYWGENEEGARYEGSTHKKCTECGTPFDKKWVYSICGECRSKIDELKDIEKYATYKREPYNGNVLYSGYFNECFNDLVDIVEHADYNSDYENTEELQNLSDDEIIQKFRVTMTEQCYCKVVDSESIIENYSDLDDDEIIPNVILEALDELNKLIEETPINYYEAIDVIPIFKNDVVTNENP